MKSAVRILWISDSPESPSGFGMVTREVCSRLAARGHDLEILGWQMRWMPTRWQGIPVRPVQTDTFGADVLLGYLMRFQPDVVITLADLWWMSFMTDPRVQRYLDQARARWAHYFPLDGVAPDGGLPQGWAGVLSRVDIPIAMSRFGQQAAASSGIDAELIPHGCDTATFAPPPDKQAAKKALGYGDAFVVLSDQRNQPRKQLPRLLEIAAHFADDNGIIFHLHTDPDDSAASSGLYYYRLLEDIELLRLKDRVRLTGGFRMLAGRGLSVEQLARLYQVADVHILTSWGEGFGLPTLQAASCGVVPMAVAYSANVELIEGHGVTVPVESTLIDEFGRVRCLLDRGAAARAIAHLKAAPYLLGELAAQGREFALGFGWDDVVDRWEEVLASAPSRRSPERARMFERIVGADGPAASTPEEMASATSETLATLLQDARVSFNTAERRFGEVASQIRAETFRDGDHASVPVRLAPFFAGAPRARIGHLLVTPADLPLIARLQHVFPGIAVSVPKPPEDPAGDRLLDLEELLPSLLGYTLVVDYAGGTVPGLDVACAALGVPFAGPSRLWPQIGGVPELQLRRLLTDQGLSEQRRLAAAAEAEAMLSPSRLLRLRHLAVPQQWAKERGG